MPHTDAVFSCSASMVAKSATVKGSTRVTCICGIGATSHTDARNHYSPPWSRADVLHFVFFVVAVCHSYVLFSLGPSLRVWSWRSEGGLEMQFAWALALRSLGLVLLVKTILQLKRAWSSAAIWIAWSHENIFQTRINQTSKHCIYLSLSIHFIIQVNDVILLCRKISLLMLLSEACCVRVLKRLSCEILWVFFGLNGFI
jgi:hypothetical protein